MKVSFTRLDRYVRKGFQALWLKARLTLLTACSAASATLIVHNVALAQGNSSSNSGGFGARQKEREQKRWYFYDWLDAKQKSREQDILYRFYTSQNEKPTPRLEPTFYGLLETGSAARSSTGEKTTLTGNGYGGSLYFNNFIAGTLGLPMPNATLGIEGSRREEKQDSKGNVIVRYAPSLRLLGKHQQDTAAFMNYRHLARNVFDERFQEWAFEGGGRIYVMPQLAAEGAVQVNEDYLKGKPSSVARHQSYWYGGYLEIAMFRLGVRIEKDSFYGRQGEGSLKEERRQAFFGFSL